MKNNYRAFDVVRVDFGDAEFAGEQAGVRPALIIQNLKGNLYSNTTIVLPFTTKIKHLGQETHSLFKKNKENGLTRDSMLLGECVRQISEERIIKKIGRITSLSEKLEAKRVYDANFEKNLIEEEEQQNESEKNNGKRSQKSNT